MKFRKKPIVIEAIRWEGDNTDEFDDFAPEAKIKCEGMRNALVIETLEGTMLAEPGDWIIRGIANELYPCKPEIFAATYEPVEYPSSPPIGVVHERVDAIATFDSMAQCPSSPQVTPPKVEVFSRPECLFRYCDTKAPHSECRERCHHA